LASADGGTVLISGETGAGKEWVARELHQSGGRRGPFVAVNCAALATHLVESELFGHVKGAFTGADRSAEGLFRKADGGTLLLDEVGELPLTTQPKLLRVLQERRVRPVGSTTGFTVDVRVIAATNRNLANDVAEGVFREDLLARIRMWEVQTPSIAARRPDLFGWLDILARAWADERRVDVPDLNLEPDAAEAVLLHPWPDNLRGLQRFVRRHAMAAANGRTIDMIAIRQFLRSAQQVSGMGSAEQVQPSASTADGAAVRNGEERPPPTPARPPRRVRRSAPSHEQLLEVLRAEGSVRAAARALDRDRTQVYRWIAAHGIKPESWR